MTSKQHQSQDDHVKSHARHETDPVGPPEPKPAKVGHPGGHADTPPPPAPAQPTPAETPPAPTPSVKAAVTTLETEMTRLTHSRSAVLADLQENEKIHVDLVKQMNGIDEQMAEIGAALEILNVM